MRKCGKLKTMAELREFWEQMLTRLQSPSKSKVQPSISIWEDKHLQQKQQEEEEEEETNSWALTSSKPNVCKLRSQTSHKPFVMQQASNLNSVRPTPPPTPLKFVPVRVCDA